MDTTLERFALADDREKVLAELIAGTEEHYYYRCLLMQQRGQARDVWAVLDQWASTLGRGGRHAHIEARQHLFDPQAEGEQRLRPYLISTLGLLFSHQREVAYQAATHATGLSEPAVDVATHRDAFARQGDVGAFSDEGVEALVAMKLPAHVLREALGRVSRPDVPGLVDAIVTELADKHSRGFGGLAIHARLMVSQLDELSRRKPALQSSERFVHLCIAHMRPGPDVDIEVDLAAREAYLERLWLLVSTLPPHLVSLRAHVLYHRLSLLRERGQADAGLLSDYLATPRNARYLPPDLFKDVKAKGQVADLWADLRSVTSLSPVGDDEPLVRDMVAQLLLEGVDAARFEPLLGERYMRELEAQVMLTAGRGDAERWARVFRDPARYQALRDQVEITLAPHNPRYLARDARVTLAAWVKNVPQLVLRVFEIDALRFYEASGAEIDATIELDGLVATHERVFTYEEQPISRVLRAFELPELDAPGVYVVELLGGGKSSRAVIRKGQLQYIERKTSAGHELTIIDERGALLADARVRLGGRDHLSDGEGRIVVPYSTSPGEKPILLCHGALTCRSTLSHERESPSLQARFFVDREALTTRGRAKLVVAAELRVNGAFASLTLLEAPTLTIEATDVFGVPTQLVLRDLKLSHDAELVQEIAAPERLASLRFTLSGKVRLASTGEVRELSASGHRGPLCSIEEGTRTYAPLLSQTAAGWVLSVLGKSGEAVPGLSLSLSLSHRQFNRAFTATVQTDAQGRVRLGKLGGVLRLTVTHGDGQETFDLAPPRVALPQALHVREGEEIVMPWPCEGATIDRAEVSLLSMRGDAFVDDRLGALSVDGGRLTIKGLAAGVYELRFKRLGHAISLQVARGVEVAGHLCTGPRIVELSEPRLLTIDRAEASPEGLRVRLGNATEAARVHVFATRFRPDLTPGLALFLPPFLSPGQIEIGAARSDHTSGRELSDETRYVLARRYAARFPGNMLGRPSLLLTPWSRQKTDALDDDLSAGGEYERAEAAKGRKMAAKPGAPAPQPRPAGGGASPNLDFLPRPPLSLTNLRPDAKGEVFVHPDALAGQAEVRVVAVDEHGAIERVIALPEPPREGRDLRLARPLPAGQKVAQVRRISCLLPGERVSLDEGAARHEIYGSLARVHALYCTTAPGDVLRELSFVLRWHQLTRAEKCTMLSKHGCHELHLFIARKDRPFFDEVVAPHLANKRERTFVDRYLLGEDLRAYLAPAAFARLNAAERALLADALPASREAIARSLAELVDLEPEDPERDEHLFRTALGGGSLDADAAPPPPPPAPAPMGGAGFGAGWQGGPAAAAPAFRATNALMGDMPEAEPSPADEIEDADGFAGFAEKEAAEEVTRGPSRPKRKGRYDADKKPPSPREQPLFREIGDTEEWAESNYHRLRLEDTTAGLVQVTPFWRDYAARDRSKPFLSPHFVRERGAVGAMLALAVLDLPFAAGRVDEAREGGRLSLSCAGPCIVVHESIEPSGEAEGAGLLLGQSYFDLLDRHVQEGNETVEKRVEGALSARRVYGCQVVLTNPSGRSRSVDLLWQIPVGAMPLSRGRNVSSQRVVLGPYATRSFEYLFYFPAAGAFSHYPAQASRHGASVGSAEAATLQVLAEPPEVDRRAWAHVSQAGTDDEVIEALGRENVARIDLRRIAWRMNDRRFFDRALEALEARFAYCRELWGYAFLHGDIRRARQLVEHEDGLLRRADLYLDSELVCIDAHSRAFYEHLEYAPLVNPRAHGPAGKRAILNERLDDQYSAQLRLLSQKPSLDDEDRLGLCYYLFLQDRIADALAMLDRVDGRNVRGKLQLDYLRAYAAFYREKHAEAREIALSRRGYPVDRWRARFDDVVAQLDEAEGGAPQVSDIDDLAQRQGQLAATEPSIALAVEGRTLVISHRHLPSCEVRYYPMDVELLFSRQPFADSLSGKLSFLRPALVEQVPLGDAHETRRPLAPAFATSNVLVEVSAGPLRASQTAFAGDLSVQVGEQYGQLRVAHAGRGTPLPRVYVKVYARSQSGQVAFFKDGYTDVRGRFDYATAGAGALEDVEKLSVLVLSAEHGAVIREVRPPSR